MHRHTKKKDLTKDPLRLNRETVGYVCWPGLGLLDGVLGPAQSLAPCACRVWRKLSAKVVLFTTMKDFLGWKPDGSSCLVCLLLLCSQIAVSTRFPGIVNQCVYSGEQRGKQQHPGSQGGKGRLYNEEASARLATARIVLEPTEFNHPRSNQCK